MFFLEWVGKIECWAAASRARRRPAFNFSVTFWDSGADTKEHRKKQRGQGDTQNRSRGLRLLLLAL
jgi:hypothetical protein